MKLFLLLLAIYSLIFYQSYKIEKLKNSILNTKESFPTIKNYRASDEAKQFQNTALIKTFNTVYGHGNKKQATLQRLGFY